jgi:hypothetical protein
MWNERHLASNSAIVASRDPSKTFFPLGSHGDKGRDPYSCP